MQYRKLSTEQDVVAWLGQQGGHSSPLLAIDIETTGLNPRHDKITSIQVANDSEAIYFDGLFVNALNVLRGFTLVFHNFRFDVNFIRRCGIRLLEHNLVRDTMLTHHLIDENTSHSLDSLVKEYFHDNYKEVFWAKYTEFAAAPEAEQIEYACKDALYTYKLWGLLEPLAPSPSLIDHVHRLAYSLFETEYRGLAVDLKYTMQMGETLQDEISKLRRDMRSMPDVNEACDYMELVAHEEALGERKTARGKAAVKWQEFNFDSTQQLAMLLYYHLNLPFQYNKQKGLTVDDAALERIEPQHPLISLIRDYRSKRKLYTAFIEGTLEHADSGRVYPSFNVNGTVTGRISSSQPNLQQLPRDGQVRGIYIPDEGHVLLSCDYSQLEVTIAAHYSQDPNLLKIVNDGASKHDITAQALNIDRQLAKTLNFAMQYQCSPFKVAQLLKVDVPQAQRVWKKYWATYAREKGVIDRCKAKLNQGQPIRNPFGRLRHFPDWSKEIAAQDVADRIIGVSTPTKYTQGYIEAFYRQAYSSLIQGTGSDLTSRAFYLTAEAMRKQDLGHALFTVHDEIMLMPRTECFDIAKEILIRNMIQVGEEMNLTVPLKVDCSEAMQRWEK